MAKAKNRHVRASQARKYRRVKRELVRLCGGQCVRCGYHHCLGALHFHHLGNKRFNLSGTALMEKPIAQLKREAAKCQLLCANCHAEEHDRGESPPPPAKVRKAGVRRTCRWCKKAFYVIPCKAWIKYCGSSCRLEDRARWTMPGRRIALARRVGYSRAGRLTGCSANAIKKYSVRRGITNGTPFVRSSRNL
jgi:hypothetical protein